MNLQQLGRRLEALAAIHVTHRRRLGHLAQPATLTDDEIIEALEALHAAAVQERARPGEEHDRGITAVERLGALAAFYEQLSKEAAATAAVRSNAAPEMARPF